jgi:outer membrane protein assembly factor BamA
VSECTDAASGSNECPEFDRLIGSRVAVASAELRIPLFGNQELGLINLPYLPTEISPFVDAGVAWSKGSSPDFRFDRRTTDRVPVVSAGVAARINVLGFAVFEIYYAHPFQRPGKGAHFGFQLAPGW